MTVVNLEALARAYQSTDGTDPELIILGHGLPDSPYDHPHDWNAILNLGTYNGQTVRFYAPRAWSYDDDTEYHAHAPNPLYQLHYGEEITTDETYVEFALTIPEGTIDRIIFLNACNDGQSLPDGAEVLTDDGIVPAKTLHAL